MANFSFVVDSSYDPMSLQEMMVPWAMYKESYDKQEETYLDLINKADKFKYLSERLPDNSIAKQIYEGYAKDLSAAASDFGNKGLTMGSRNALFGLRRRYQGEIGTLADADEIVREIRKTRLDADSKGVPMIWANDDITIDDVLASNFNPNNFGVSADDLFNKGAVIGKAMSSREYNNHEGKSIFDGYYNEWVSQNGIHPSNIPAFMRSKVVQDAIDQMMVQSGVASNMQPGSPGWLRARQAIESGIVNGIIYNETVTPKENKGKLSLKEELDMQAKGLYIDADGRLQWDPERSLDIKKQRYMIDNGLVADPTATSTSTSATGSKKGKSNAAELFSAYGINPVPLRKSTDVSSSMQHLQRIVDKKYVVQTAKGKVFSDDGINKLMDGYKFRNYNPAEAAKYSRNSPSAISISMNTELDNNRKGFVSMYNEMKKLNGGKELFTGSGNNIRLAPGMTYDKVNSLMNKYIAQVEGTDTSYDTYRDTQYVQTYTDTQKKLIKQATMAMEQDFVNVVEYNGKDGWNATRMPKDKLEKFEPSVGSGSIYGYTDIWTNDKGETVRVYAPLNPMVDDAYKRIAAQTDIANQIINKGKKPKVDKDGNVVVDAHNRVQFTDSDLSIMEYMSYNNNLEDLLSEQKQLGMTRIVGAEAKKDETDSSPLGVFNY